MIGLQSRADCVGGKEAHRQVKAWKRAGPVGVSLTTGMATAAMVKRETNCSA
jgi:hypothetical protein